MSVHYVILAIERRAAWAQALASTLRATAPTAVTVLYDTFGRGSRYSYTMAMLAGLTAGARSVVVIEDDVELCDNFTAHIEDIVAVVPDRVVSLFNARKDGLTAFQNGAAWSTCAGDHYNTQGLIYPAWFVERFCSYMAAHPECHGPGMIDHDWMIHLFVEAGMAVGKCRRIIYTAPSLVEHAGVGQSTLGHTNKVGGRPVVASVFVKNLKPGTIQWGIGIPG